MKQMTLAQGRFKLQRKPARRDKFLSKMESTIPWVDLCRLLGLDYPQAGHGRPPVGLEKMLRLHLLQFGACAEIP
ncbi:hypothetical protein [Undibacterium sp.]|jgi:IS5 family transposase|uniref:hypothetical protein n=1 Tax=Undibacterium sp. TaxID=1914977 RepID=UPI002BB8E035|nr:hypothetical protein [Undibacterium sp.]HTD05521.1 hypothetical protein [Undibacterium sp.]